jgi:hypothetical protein
MEAIDTSMSSGQRESLERSIEKTFSEKLDTLIQAKIDRRFRQLKWIVALAGLIGLGTFGTLANYLIQQAVDLRAGRVTQTMNMLRVNMLAMKLDIAKSFTREESSSVMALLRTIAHNDEAKSLPDFPVTLTKVVLAFSAADLNANVDQLFELFPSEILASPSMVETLLNHYGQEIVGRAVPVVGQSNDVYLRDFESLERVAASSNVPEIALLYRTLFEYRMEDKHPSPRIFELVDRAEYLSRPDHENYVRQLLDHSKADNWQREPTVTAKAVATTVRQFLHNYGGTIASHLRIPAFQVEQWAKQGVDRETAAVIVATLSRNEADAAKL